MPSRRIPGEESPRFVDGVSEDGQPAWWEQESALSMGGARLVPGLTSRDSVFSRLHADSASRLERLERMQEEAQRGQLERDREFVKPCRGHASELDGACRRLYGDAEMRRQRQAKKQQDQQYLEELQNELHKGGRSAPNLLAVDADCRFDRLYANASEKNKRLERERQRKLEEELRYMELHSVHKGSGTDSAFSRLYQDSQAREWRREQQRILEAESESMRLAEDSVHHRGRHHTNSQEDAGERLYKEGLARKQRLEEQKQRLHREEVPAPKKSSPGVVPRRIDALYKDATRRKQDREWQQEQCEKRLMLELMKDSVHAGVSGRQWNPKDVERIFERQHKPARRTAVPSSPLPASPASPVERAAPGRRAPPGETASPRAASAEPRSMAPGAGAAPARKSTGSMSARPSRENAQRPGSSGSLASPRPSGPFQTPPQNQTPRLVRDGTGVREVLDF